MYVTTVRATDLAFARLKRHPVEGASTEQEARSEALVATEAKMVDRVRGLDDTVKKLAEAVATCNAAP